MSDRDPVSVPWHALPESDAFRKLDSGPGGITQSRAAERLREFGPNVLPSKNPPTVAAIFLHQFLSPLIYILLAAGLISVLIGDLTDAGFIVAVVLFNAGVGTFQEWKAEKSAARLRQLLEVTARVTREGQQQELAASALVPGDIVHLESGARVPADLRLLKANSLAIDESLLTGESLPVEKQLKVVPAGSAVAERLNMAFAASIVTTGRATGIVVATGLRTEVGKIARSVTTAETTQPPLVIRMEKFARQVSLVVVAACVLIAAASLFRGMPLVQVFFLAVALAVAAIPEGLPVAITIALSIASRRMSQRNVIVRRLTAVEGLGSCTYIASDKTGTLTVNKQTVAAVWLSQGGRYRIDAAGVAEEGGQPAGTDFRNALRSIAATAIICNEASVELRDGEWRAAGDPVDVAFWEFAKKLDVDARAIRDLAAVGDVPYESERGYAARFYRRNGNVHAAVKGAPEVVLARCEHMGGSEREIVDRELAALSRSGHRVIAVAEAGLRSPDSPAYGEDDLRQLTLLGLIGLIDPPRPEVIPAVKNCRQAGIQVAMVTGDHPLTALAIARQVGIADSDGEVVTGRELAEIGGPDVPEFLDRVASAHVFARVSPLQKLDIVDALVRLGHFVAVTGDGVNDAPALKRANIGVAMGSGTDIAKETASLIVTDDNFASIEAGVEEGRFAYDNIRKVTYLLISTGAAEVVLFLLAMLSGMPIPLLPVQLLWLNLVTNGIQHVALALEGGEPETLRRPPRKPSEGIFNRLMVQQTAISGAAMGFVAYANFYLLLSVMGLSEFEARNHLLLLMVLLENFHVFNCRSEYRSAFRVPLSRNPFLVLAVLSAQGLHILAMFVPLTQRVLHVGPVARGEWAVAFAIASSILIVMEIFKFFRLHRLP